MFTKRYLRYMAGAIIVMIVNSANFAIAAERLFKLDFEQEGWEQYFRGGAWSGKVARTENASRPGSGNFSLRGNLQQNRIDPITGLPGEGNMQLEFVGNNLSTYTDHEVFIRFWIRYDDSTWLPNEGGKTFYLTDVNVGTAAFYFSSDMKTNNGSMSDNGSFFRFCVDNWGYQKAYLKNSENSPVGSDGIWHKIELYINYDDNYIIYWVDGRRLTGTGSRAAFYPDGQLPLPEEFHLRGLQITYVHDANLVDSTDGSGYACGFQLDDFEIWDTLPPDVGIVPDPTSPGKPGTPVYPE